MAMADIGANIPGKWVSLTELMMFVAKTVAVVFLLGVSYRTVTLELDNKVNRQEFIELSQEVKKKIDMDSVRIMMNDVRDMKSMLCRMSAYRDDTACDRDKRSK